MVDHWVEMSERGTRLRPEDPSHVGEYELIGRLGSGGMGVVYKARARDGRPVAVKVVQAELAGNDEFRSRFRSEVARARQVPPFCTAEVLDADPDAPQPYLVVEFVDGPSLAEEVARRGPLRRRICTGSRSGSRRRWSRSTRRVSSTGTSSRTTCCSRRAARR
jgi:serine/threonine protein kinase